MSAQKSQRLTIRAHNIEFLKTIGAQMGISDLAEICNYLILDCKGLGYAFGNKPQPQPTPQQPQAPIGYAFDSSTFEPAFQPTHKQNHINNQADETILRLASLIENF
ncbi:hypothetical protein OGM63_13510 [Plectonema radiosum NIES-515]|uniref:Uncharacterized protein n=1 Tax=Plectonema radiosum NIES-515 TaxID=2986073 RepID=A0ABT3AZG4_9CYAN|nr:hypothetical protein [Plectonema radiosum]MCV3214517.1 hypothetical protein [Plectonema radiosum NIES-515]